MDLLEYEASLVYKGKIQDRLQSYGETMSRKIKITIILILLIIVSLFPGRTMDMLIWKRGNFLGLCALTRNHGQ